MKLMLAAPCWIHLFEKQSMGTVEDEAMLSDGNTEPGSEEMQGQLLRLVL